MSYLSAREFEKRGDMKAVISSMGEHGTLMALAWMDRDRRYFISSCSNLKEGEPYSRQRWRQVSEEPNAPPERVDLEVPQPRVCEAYYRTCARIDQHNRCRQDDLELERAIGTHDWAKRLNLTIFAMSVVDSWLVYKKCTDVKETQAEFYAFLAEEMIDNTLDGVTIRCSARTVATANPVALHVDGTPRCGIAAHLTPTKLKRRKKDGALTPYTLQGNCMVCKKKTTWTCSQCIDDDIDGRWESKQPWLCSSSSGRVCFGTHLTEVHGL